MSKQKGKQVQRELNDEEKNIVICVRHCARELDDILQGARRKVQSNAHLFAESTACSLFRGIESYADLYEKLKVKSRAALDRLFYRARDVDDMLDAQDAIEETEDCWRNFLSNVDKEVGNIGSPKVESSSSLKLVGDYIDVSKPMLFDCQSNTNITLEQAFANHTSLLLIFQPAYLPDICARWRHSEMAKIQADFHRLNVGCLVVTWGPEELVRSWSKRLLKHVKWPVLWDRENYFTSDLNFNSGCSALWAPEMLDFCGCQRVIFKRSVDSPPSDLNWHEWRWVGAEVVIASPKISWLMYKRDLEQFDSKEIREADDPSPHDSQRPKLPESSSSSRICLIHRSDNIADFAQSGSIYQSALSCHATSLNMSESDVMDDIRLNRRLSTPPESARLQFESLTGMHYDPETELHYDSKTGYFYDASNQMYYYWSKDEHRYLSANTLVQAQIEATQAAQLAALQAAAMRAVAEQEAAKAVGAQVAAQLAAIRSQKDEYSSYAYATCVLSQQPWEAGCASGYGADTTTIEESLGLVGKSFSGISEGISNTVPATSYISLTSTYPANCPPPPGV